RVRVIGRVDEQILPDFFHHTTEERFISLAAEKNPARFQIIAWRVAKEISGVIPWILKMIVHTFYMSWNPTDSSFEKGKFKVLIAVQQPGTQHAGQAGHDRQYSRQHPIWKMVLEQFVDNRKLKTEVNRNGQI